MGGGGGRKGRRGGGVKGFGEWGVIVGGFGGLLVLGEYECWQLWVFMVVGVEEIFGVMGVG